LGKPGVPLEELKAKAFNKVDTIPDATIVPWFLDNCWRSSFPDVTNNGSTDPQTPWGPGTNSTGFEQMQMDRHPSANINVSFADGHAEPVGVDDLDQLRWHIDWPTDGSVVVDTNW